MNSLFPLLDLPLGKNKAHICRVTSLLTVTSLIRHKPHRPLLAIILCSTAGILGAFGNQAF